MEGLEAGGERAEVDRVFFGGDEAGGTRLLGFRGEIAHVGGGVGVVIAEDDFAGKHDAAGAEVVEKTLGAGDGAEGEHRAGRQIKVDGAAQAPNMLAGAERQFVRADFGRENHGVGARDGAERLAQASGGNEAVAQVGVGEQNDIEVARKLSVLETIVE